ncbi:response regulator [Dyella jejuensis]|uniref:Response regulator n=1 Tax=Dyella jejuensis TaxID=1432009 RepID=A0ABW8JL13_9GAMM
MHVLVVEDDLDTRDLLHHALLKAGYEVSLARGVSDALRLSRLHPDIGVVIMDMHRGHRLSILEMTHEMRQYLPHGHYVLASGEWDALEPSCQRDMTVLRKPYGMNDLLHAVRRCDTRRENLLVTLLAEPMLLPA